MKDEDGSSGYVTQLSHLRETHSDEILNYREQYRRMDRNHDGFLDRKEFQQALGLMGVNNKFLTDLLFSAFDLGHDELIDENEYVIAMMTMTSGDAEKKLDIAFKLYDTDGSGHISRDEGRHIFATMSSALSGMGLSEPIDVDARVDELFRRCDVDNDGSISLEEYKRAAQLDPNFFRELGIVQTSQPRKTSAVHRPTSKKKGKSKGGGSTNIAAKGSIGIGSDKWDFMLKVMVGIRVSLDQGLQDGSGVSPDKRGSSRTSLVDPNSSFTSDADSSPQSSARRGLRTHHLETADYLNKQEFQLPKDASLEEQYGFKDFAPKVFASLRLLFGVAPTEYALALGPEGILGSLLLGEFASLGEMCSEGKSGSFFYYSACGNYILKTISKAEQNALLTMLPAYHAHMKMYSQTTLLTQFVGCHKLKLKHGGGKISLIIMRNVFNTEHVMHSRYDLKGSTVGRRTPNVVPGDLETPLGVTLKDLDVGDRKMTMPEDRHSELMLALAADTRFLERQNIVDYSLLLGVHVTQPGDAAANASSSVPSSPLSPRTGEQESFSQMPSPASSAGMNNWAWEGGVESVDGSERYFVGIIDILIQYNSRKKGERFFKSIVYQASGISVAPPPMYQTRFVDFMANVFKGADIVPEQDRAGFGTRITSGGSTAAPQSDDVDEPDAEVLPLQDLSPRRSFKATFKNSAWAVGKFQVAQNRVAVVKGQLKDLMMQGSKLRNDLVDLKQQSETGSADLVRANQDAVKLQDEMHTLESCLENHGLARKEIGDLQSMLFSQCAINRFHGASEAHQSRITHLGKWGGGSGQAGMASAGGDSASPSVMSGRDGRGRGFIDSKAPGPPGQGDHHHHAQEGFDNHSGSKPFDAGASIPALASFTAECRPRLHAHLAKLRRTSSSYTMMSQLLKDRANDQLAHLKRMADARSSAVDSAVKLRHAGRLGLVETAYDVSAGESGMHELYEENEIHSVATGSASPDDNHAAFESSSLAISELSAARFNLLRAWLPGFAERVSSAKGERLTPEAPRNGAVSSSGSFQPRGDGAASVLPPHANGSRSESIAVMEALSDEELQNLAASVPENARPACGMAALKEFARNPVDALDTFLFSLGAVVGEKYLSPSAVQAEDLENPVAVHHALRRDAQAPANAGRESAQFNVDGYRLGCSSMISVLYQVQDACRLLRMDLKKVLSVQGRLLGRQHQMHEEIECLAQLQASPELVDQVTVGMSALVVKPVLSASALRSVTYLLSGFSESERTTVERMQSSPKPKPAAKAAKRRKSVKSPGGPSGESHHRSSATDHGDASSIDYSQQPQTQAELQGIVKMLWQHFEKQATLLRIARDEHDVALEVQDTELNMHTSVSENMHNRIRQLEEQLLACGIQPVQPVRPFSIFVCGTDKSLLEIESGLATE